MKTARYTDDKLISKFKQGDAGAFAAIYDMYFNPLFYFSYRLTGNSEEAKDIASDSLEILLTKYKDFETLTNIKAFLYITVRNRSLKYHDRIERKKTSEKEIADQLEENENAFLPEIIRTEFIKAIQQEIENLAPTRRTVFKLFFLDGLTTEEICKKLNMTPDAVWGNKSRAVQQLRNILINKKLLSFFAGMLNIAAIRGGYTTSDFRS